MDNFGADLADTGAVLTQDQLEERRKRGGLCPKCGQKCFTKKALKFERKLLANAVLDRLEPLTVDGKVLNGRCLICEPQTQEELDQIATQLAQDAAAEEKEKLFEASASTLGLNHSDHSGLADTEGLSSGPPTGSKRTGLRGVLTRPRASTASDAEKIDGDDQALHVAMTKLSHDEFFAQYDMPVLRKTSFDGDGLRESNPVRRTHFKANPRQSSGSSSRMEYNSRRHADGRTNMRERETRLTSASGHSMKRDKYLNSSKQSVSFGHAHLDSKKRENDDGYEEKLVNRGHHSFHDSHSSMRREHPSFSMHSGSFSPSSPSSPDNKRTESNHGFENKHANRRHSEDIGVEHNDDVEMHSFDESRSGFRYHRSNTRTNRRRLSSSKLGNRRRALIREGSCSADIGRIMRRSQRKLNHVRPMSKDSSQSSSSSESDDDSSDFSSSCSSSDSDASSEFSAYLEADTVRSSIKSVSIPWQDKRTPQEQMQSILDHLVNTAIKCTTNLTKIRESYADLEEKASYAKKTRWYASKQANDAKEQQAIAAEEEDYKVAAVMGSIIQENLKALKKTTAACWGINKTMLKLNHKKEEAIRVATHCMEDSKNKLSELHGKLVDSLEETERQLSDESIQLSTQSDCLAEELKSIEQEEELFANERKELVGEEMEEIEERLGQDSAKLLEVNGTIQELRKRLAKAEAEAANLKVRIEVSSEKLNDIQDRFPLELEQLETKYGSLKERRSIWLSKNKTNSEAKSVHEARVSTHSGEAESMDKVIINMNKEILAATNFEKLLASAFDIEKTKKCQDDDDDAAEMDEIVMYQALVDEKQELLFDAQDHIDDLTEEMFNIEASLPDLEAKKTAAASKGSFKSASKASRKIKKALARREKCQTLLNGKAAEREQSAQDELKKYTALLAEQSKVVDEKGREAGMERIKQLKDMSKRLSTSLTAMASESEEEAPQVSVVVGFLINAQLSVLKTEGETLSEKYGGWEDITPDRDDVEKFLAPIIVRVERNRSAVIRSRLSVLLDKKIAASFGRISTMEDYEEQNNEESEAKNCNSATTVAKDARRSRVSVLLDEKMAASFSRTSTTEDPKEENDEAIEAKNCNSATAVAKDANSILSNTS